MKRLFATFALTLLGLSAFGATRNERAELEAVYRGMARAFASKDIHGYTACWVPAIRWFPPRSSATTALTKGKAELLRDLREEFRHGDKVSRDYGFTSFAADPERVTVDLAVSTVHSGPPSVAHIGSERHHWFKAGGRWWLSRIEAIG
jgi:hypothetical protein